jgi:hypothetical protein
MNRMIWRLAISAALGLVLTLASLGYSQATFYPVAGTSGTIMPIYGWGARGYPLPYVVNYCSCCLLPLNPASYPSCSNMQFMIGNALVDYAFWFALAFLVVSLLDALWPRLGFRNAADTLHNSYIFLGNCFCVCLEGQRDGDEARHPFLLRRRRPRWKTRSTSTPSQTIRTT